tara:strand:+ start:17332 stop:18531 length:1200 start_codon:yes stop_codon:yes gene_type:complete
LNTKKNVLIAAQTPYQFFSAVLITSLLIDSGSKVSLLLIDPALKQFYFRCKDSSIFEKVQYVEINKREVSLRSNKLTNKIKRLLKLKKIEKDIKNNLIDCNFSNVIVFSDNHDITAYLLYAAKKFINAKTTMAEEGTTVFFSYKRLKLGIIKSYARKIIGFSNYRGYSIGWSPYIDTIIVSLPSLVHDDYKQDRTVYSYPNGEIPNKVISLFSKLSGLGEYPIDTIAEDIVFLGQPFTELGMWDKSTEEKLLDCLDNSKVSNRICIKPHPFETAEKYKYLNNISLMDGYLFNFPAEAIFFRLKPKLIISVFSSALINYCLRYKRMGIFMAFEDLNNEQNSFIMNNFSDNKYIRIVKSVDELEEALNSNDLFKPITYDNNQEGSPCLWSHSIHSALSIEQ